MRHKLLPKRYDLFISDCWFHAALSTGLKMIQVNTVSCLTHEWDSLRRVDLANSLHLRRSCRGLWKQHDVKTTDLLMPYHLLRHSIVLGIT